MQGGWVRVGGGLSRVSIGNILRQKHQRQRHVTVTIVLALATLGNMIQIEMILSVLRCPRWPRQVPLCNCHVSLSPMVSLTNIANVNDPLVCEWYFVPNFYNTKIWNMRGGNILKPSYNFLTLVPWHFIDCNFVEKPFELKLPLFVLRWS